MSSYFFGGFSANLIVPSGRQSNHSGCSLIHGWSGEHWMAKSMRDLEPVLVRGVDQPLEGVEVAEFGMQRVVAAFRRADRVGRAGIVRPPASANCCAPCGWSCRSGGSAGNRARRSRGRGRRAGAAITSSKVPWRFMSNDIERGISSYQARDQRRLAVDPDRQPAVGRQVRADADATHQRRRLAGHQDRERLAFAGLVQPVVQLLQCAASPRRRRRRPSARLLDDQPAPRSARARWARRRHASWRPRSCHEAKRSRQATIRNSCAPISSKVAVPRQRSLMTNASAPRATSPRRPDASAAPRRSCRARRRRCPPRP